MMFTSEFAAHGGAHTCSQSSWSAPTGRFPRAVHPTMGSACSATIMSSYHDAYASVRATEIRLWGRAARGRDRPKNPTLCGVTHQGGRGSLAVAPRPFGHSFARVHDPRPNPPKRFFFLNNTPPPEISPLPPPTAFPI